MLCFHVKCWCPLRRRHQWCITIGCPLITARQSRCWTVGRLLNGTTKTLRTDWCLVRNLSNRMKRLKYGLRPSLDVGPAPCPSVSLVEIIWNYIVNSRFDLFTGLTTFQPRADSSSTIPARIDTLPDSTWYISGTDSMLIHQTLIGKVPEKKAIPWPSLAILERLQAGDCVSVSYQSSSLRFSVNGRDLGVPNIKVNAPINGCYVVIELHGAIQSVKILIFLFLKISFYISIFPIIGKCEKLSHCCTCHSGIYGDDSGSNSRTTFQRTPIIFKSAGFTRSSSRHSECP